MITEIQLTEAIAEDVALSGELIEKLTLLAHPSLAVLKNRRMVILTLTKDHNKSVSSWAFCTDTFWGLTDAKEIFFGWIKAGDTKKAWILAGSGNLGVVDGAVLHWIARQGHKGLRFLMASNSTLAKSPVAMEVALLLARDVDVDVRVAIGNNLWLADLPKGFEICRVLNTQKK